MKVKKIKKSSIKGDSEESINNCECPRSSDESGDMLPVVKNKKKKKIELERTDQKHLTVQWDNNTTTVPISDNVEFDSKNKLKRRKRKLEKVANSVKCTPQNVNNTDKISKIKNKPPAPDNDISKIDDENVVTKDELLGDDTPVKAKKKKKKKKKSSGNEIIDEHEYAELDEFIGELDEESNAQYDNWVKQIDSIFKKPV